MTKQEYRYVQRRKPIGPEGIAQCRDIVNSGSYAKVNEVMVDTFSASAIIAVYDALNPINQAKMVALPVPKAASIAFGLLK